MCTEFEKMMHKKFQISSMGELTFFLGLQVTQKDDGIFISQDKYVDEILKKFGFSTMRITSTPMETSKPLLKDAKAEDVDVYNLKVSHLHAVKRIFRYLKGQPKLGFLYPKDSPFDLEAYSDSDYASASLDRKSTTGCSEYVAAANCCGQAIEISQSSGATNLVANETVHDERGDSVERAATTDTSLNVEQGSGNIIRTQSTATLNEPIPQGTGSSSGPMRQDTILRDIPAQTRVLDLENVKDAQALEIQKLKKRVKNLESNKKSRTPQLKRRLFKMKSEKSKAKGVTMQEPSEFGTREQEREDLTIKERSKLFVELMNERKKHFTRLRAEEQRRKPPTKTQKRNLMSTYLKNMAGYKHTQLKNKSFEEIQMLFEKEMKRVNIFVDMDEELVKGSETIESKVDRAVPKLAAGSSKSSELAKEPGDKEADELSQEELQQMMIIVPKQGMNEASKEYSFLKLGGYMILMVHHEAIEKGNDIYMLGREESPIVKEPLHNAVAKPWSIKIMRCPRELLQERNSCMLKNQENKVLEYILLLVQDTTAG
ncbi:putative ribonuclease H-like domain-containing protein [Tanacetum coccineum]|uniref:Ribonuclease H-like domain-containing protein n=2 Tax=Tanacetum coccineum TaxID=301880 RepID=A0ABQ4ZL72_9ASTR